MVSSKFSSRGILPRSPVVCVAGPKPPAEPIQLRLWILPDPVEIYEHAAVRIFACNDVLPKGDAYETEWDAGCGYMDPNPEARNCMEGVGTWFSPGEPCECEVNVKVTWSDGTSAFAFVRFSVVDTHEE